MSRFAPLFVFVALLGLLRSSIAQEPEKEAPTEVKQPLALIEYELTIVHLGPGENGQAENYSAIDLPNAMKVWQDQGRIRWMKSLRLAACDNQSAHVQFGEKKAVATGVDLGGRSGRSRATAYQYEDLGLVFGVTGRVEADQSITVELDVKHSDLEAPKVENPSNDEAVDFVPAETRTNLLQTTVRLRDGKAMLIGGGLVDSPDEKSETLVFVSAKMAE